ncbi:MAG: App1 family protein [Vicingaceae bacterium]
MIYLWHFTQIELEDKIWLSGSLLKGDSPSLKYPKSILGHFFQIIRSYRRSAAKELTLKLKSDQEEVVATTNRKGHFSVLMEKYNQNSLRVFHNSVELELPTDYPTFFPMNDKSIEVISDLDDTVLHSNTSSVLKRIFNILFILPQNRKTILFTYQLFERFKEMGFRITYLSKSEANLFHLIALFIQYHDLPKGPLLLTQHLKWRQLAKPKKDKDHKMDRLRRMLSGMPTKKFILLGDDTQRDMEVYAAIVKEFENRIEKIFIRQTGFSRSAKQEELWNELQKTNVDALYFDDSHEADLELKKINPSFDETVNGH